MTSRSRVIHGFKVEAHSLGSTDDGAPLLVFVHGMMEPSRVWKPVAAALGDRYRCVVLDLPWNGEQGGFWGRHMGPQAWLRAALDGFGLKPDGWVAHSFGASAVLSLLATEERDDGAGAPAVLISPFFKHSHREVTWPLFERYVREFTRFVELSIRVRLRDKALDGNVLRRMTEAARDKFGCYVWTQFWQLFAEMPFLPLARLKQPMLLLTGADDFSSPLPDLEALAAALPNAALQVYPDCSHFLLSSSEREVSEATRRFLLAECPASHRPAPGRPIDFSTPFPIRAPLGIN